MIGKWHGKNEQKDGKKMNILLEQVNYAPRLCANLFSVTRALLQDRKPGNEKLVMTLEKNGKMIIFDHFLGSDE